MKLERRSYGLEIKFADDSEAKAGSFSGYGAVFGNVDSYGDVIAKGAFKESLKDWKKRKRLPAMLLQHGGFFGPAEDGIPVGLWTEMSEDDTGLFVKGELFALDTDKGRYIHEGLKSGALDGLSIGYIAREVAYGKKPEDPPRTLKKIDLREVSIVTFPANDAARVDSAKSIEAISTLSEAEDYLRDACGFSRAQAVAFVSRIKSLRPSDSERAIVDANSIGARLLSQITPKR
jgi:uncharacterized protein